MVKALYMRTRDNVFVKFLDMNNLIKLQQKAQEKLEEYGINIRLPEKEFGYDLRNINPLLLNIKHYDPEKTIIDIQGVGEFEYESFLFSPELDHDKYIEVSLERLRLKLECQVEAYGKELERIEGILEKLIS
jgi:hypothetical protein